MARACCRHVDDRLCFYNSDMKKTYISKNSVRLVTSVCVEGEEVAVVFERERRAPKWRNGSFSTDNESVQRALESGSAYGRDYVLAEGLNRGAGDDEMVLCVAVEQVHDKQSALRWAQETLGVRMSGKMTERRIREAVAKRGYCFPNWKEREV